MTSRLRLRSRSPSPRAGRYPGAFTSRAHAHGGSEWASVSRAEERGATTSFRTRQSCVISPPCPTGFVITLINQSIKLAQLLRST
eukprot:scaffold734_cov35-Tisochrysis_lutea.AAC.1